MQRWTRLIDPVRGVWEDALRLDPAASLESNLVLELAEYLEMPYSQVEHLCHSAVELTKETWSSADRSTDEQVLKFYQEPNYYFFELTWWHSMLEDRRFLDSAICMKYAMQKGLHRFLDFGCGTGSHSIMMANNGFDVAMFDVSKQLVDFAEWRVSRRGHECKAFVGDEDWKPELDYDFILVLDVLEHATSPYKTLMQLASMLKANGILCISVPPIHVPNRPMHSDYYRRHLLSDTKGLGLHHIKSLGTVHKGPATGHEHLDNLG